MQGHLWYPLPQDTAQHKARAIPRPPEGGLTSDGQFRHCDQSAHPSARSALHPVARDAAVNATSEGMSMKAMSEQYGLAARASDKCSLTCAAETPSFGSLFSTIELRSASGIHVRYAHLNIASHPFIESQPRFPLVFKALRVTVVRNYPGEKDTSRKSLM